MQNSKKEKKRINVFSFGLKTIFIMLVSCFVLFNIGAFTVPIFASTEYVSETKNIYGVWQNKYQEEFQNGKHKTTRYCKKTQRKSLQSYKRFKNNKR